MRERVEDVDVEKFVVRHGEPVLADGQTSVVAYDVQGGVTEEPGSPRCVAKAVTDHATGTRYFAKASTLTGGLVDPAQNEDLGRPGDWTARGRWEFRPIGQEAFDRYVDFLQSGNPAHLREAERARRS